MKFSMNTITLWVDADACPAVMKEILFRAANRVQVPMNLVANHWMKVPASPLIKLIQVESGFDVADDYIVQHVNKDDLVITSDIPLASEVIEKGAHVITARGEKLTLTNIRQKLNMRDFMDTMRASGEVGGGPPALGAKDKQAFGNSLDQYLAKFARKK